MAGIKVPNRPRRLAAWAAAKSVPWLLLVTHERLEPGVDAAATLDACGLAVVMPMTGMLSADGCRRCHHSRPAADRAAG